ncbi:MAG: dihydrofolate reductase family protein [Rikenellaceae bacterium]
MKIIASLATSNDGYINDNSPQRLVISNDKDWEKVYALRANVDAIMIGAATLREDNPSLLVKGEENREKRQKLGLNPDIIKVVLSSSLDINADAKFFTRGDVQKIVLCLTDSPKSQKESLSKVAKIIELSELTPIAVVSALEAEGIATLMIEGGVKTLEPFFAANLVDEFRLAVSDKKVEDDLAPKFYDFEKYISDSAPEMKLLSKQFLDEIGVYNFVKKDDYYLEMAVGESMNAVPTKTNYRVGAVIVCENAAVYLGYTGESHPKNHAEEEALIKAKADNANLYNAVIYTSMEPCSKRASKEKSCSELILENGIKKVVYAFKEPDYFVECTASENLVKNGVEVVVNSALGDAVKQINSHILG